MGSAASAGKGERHKEGWKTQAARMPEVEKQSAVASEGSGESLEKPGGLSFEVVLEEAEGGREPSKVNGSFNFGEACSGGEEKRGGSCGEGGGGGKGSCLSFGAFGKTFCFSPYSLQLTIIQPITHQSQLSFKLNLVHLTLAPTKYQLAVGL